jgi:hypothetical protein
MQIIVLTLVCIPKLDCFLINPQQLDNLFQSKNKVYPQNYKFYDATTQSVVDGDNILYVQTLFIFLFQQCCSCPVLLFALDLVLQLQLRQQLSHQQLNHQQLSRQQLDLQRPSHQQQCHQDQKLVSLDLQLVTSQQLTVQLTGMVLEARRGKYHRNYTTHQE